MARQTSVEVYNSIMADGSVAKMRKRVYDILFKFGPLTASELHARAKDVYSDLSLRDNYQKRLPELRKMGIVSETGTRVCSITSREVIEWDVTDKLPQPLVKSVARKKFFLFRNSPSEAFQVVDSRMLIPISAIEVIETIQKRA